MSSKDKKYHRYNIYTLSISIFAILIVGIFNYFINPYDVFSTQSIKYVNQIKPQKINHERFYKAIDIIKIKPKTIILGSSTAGSFEPENLGINLARPIYNLKLNGASIYEILKYLEHSYVNQSNLNTVILGLDFFAFNHNDMLVKPGFEKYRFKKTYLTKQDIFRAMFSLKVLVDSFVTLRENLILSYKTGDNLNRNKHTNKTNLKFFVQSNRYHDFALSNAEIDYFKNIVDLCQQNNLELKIFISPFHAVQSEMVYKLGLWSDFVHWKKEIVAITPVWDFSGYNSINTEPINPYMKNYTDGVHYNLAVSNLILKRIFDYQTESIPQDFGFYLTPDNFQDRLILTKKNRTYWLNHNSNVLTKWLDRY